MLPIVKLPLANVIHGGTAAPLLHWLNKHQQSAIRHPVVLPGSCVLSVAVVFCMKRLGFDKLQYLGVHTSFESMHPS